MKSIVEDGFTPTMENILKKEESYLVFLSELSKLRSELDPQGQGENNKTISEDDFNKIFLMTKELHDMHRYGSNSHLKVNLLTNNFLSMVKILIHWNLREFYGDLLDLVRNNKDPRIGHIFVKLSKQCNIYITFIQNYPEALRTVDSCAKNSSRFADLVTKRNIQNNQTASLSELLYKPIVR